MAIRARGSAFQIDVKVAGKDNPTKSVVRIRTTSKDESSARLLEAEIRASVMKTGTWFAADAPAPSSKAIGTLGAALEEAWSYPSGRRPGWKFQKSGKELYRKAKQCVDLLGPGRHCSTIATADLEDLARKFIALGNNNDTVGFKIQALFRVLWHAQRKGWITHRPLWDRPAPGKPREFIFTNEFEIKVIEFFQEHERDLVMRDLFILGIETGMRLGELLASVVEDWSIEDRVVYVRHDTAKSGYGRAVTLTDRAIDTIRPMIEKRDRNYQLFRWSKQLVGRKMKKARSHFDMDHNREFCFHATRHTRATRLARQTRDPFVVMSQLGHSNIATSMRYIKLAAIPQIETRFVARDLVRDPVTQGQAVENTAHFRAR